MAGSDYFGWVLVRYLSFLCHVLSLLTVAQTLPSTVLPWSYHEPLRSFVALAPSLRRPDTLPVDVATFVTDDLDAHSHGILVQCYISIGIGLAALLASHMLLLSGVTLEVPLVHALHFGAHLVSSVILFGTYVEGTHVTYMWVVCALAVAAAAVDAATAYVRVRAQTRYFA
eukprot:TRINITY_DN71924_c0_g1_i1.p1 TRINITY_DN71924_c0_g1~~TRINITY_DN71924_c0_g1_i1.p1  ORF type:complete len:171 (-),score=21.07 TRINITY_DN71924_c0_g1_i1:67-579(-)